MSTAQHSVLTTEASVFSWKMIARHHSMVHPVPGTKQPGQASAGAIVVGLLPVGTACAFSARLRGRSEYYVRFIAFLENNDERCSPAGRLSALIEFDETIEFEGISGKYGLLDLRYSDGSWGENPGVVHVTLLTEREDQLYPRKNKRIFTKDGESCAL